MAWLDDRAWAHPKVTRLTPNAFRVWVSGICYASGFSTSGRLEREHQRLVGATARIRGELVTAGLWDEVDAGAVVIHDWDEHNGRRDAKRKSDRERKQRQRDRERDVTRDIGRDNQRDRRGLTGDRVTKREPNGSLAGGQRVRNPIWDALVEVFGEPSTDTARTLRGKVCSSLTRAGATPEEVVSRAKSWPRHFEGATLTETALEKHWDALGRRPLRLEQR